MTTPHKRCLLVFEEFKSIRGLCPAWEVISDTGSTWEAKDCREGDTARFSKGMVRLGVKEGTVKVIERKRRDEWY